MGYFYLHGLASGPASAKAKYLRDRFRSQNLELVVPDLNQENFAQLTLTRQIEQVEALICGAAESCGTVETSSSHTLIGSSFGGLTAAWVAQRQPSVERLVLLAPAFEFLPAWLKIVGPKQAQTWQATGRLATYHYAYRRMETLDYGIVTDMERYCDGALGRSLPTLILHGRDDRVIPIEASRRYGASRPWVQLIELESDHSLGNSVSRIWQEIQRFCSLSSKGSTKPG